MREKRTATDPGATLLEPTQGPPENGRREAHRLRKVRRYLVTQRWLSSPSHLRIEIL